MDNLNNVPESVTVVFPRGDDRWALHHVETVSGAGHTGTQLIHSSAIAPYVGSLEPVNSEEIAALAAQIAADFYAWRKASVEIRYESVVPWTPDGMHDLEYSHGAGISTAVHRSEWEPDQGELQHAGQFGSRDGPQYHTPAVGVLVDGENVNGTYDALIQTRNNATGAWADGLAIWAIDLAGSDELEADAQYDLTFAGVEAGGGYFVSIQASNTDHALTDAAWWLPVVGSISPAAWSGATAYVAGNLVTSGGDTYICILGHTNHVPPNGTYWVLVTLDDLGGFDEQGTYGAGDYVQEVRALHAIQFALASAITSLNGDETSDQDIALGKVGSDINLKTAAAAYSGGATYSAGWVVTSGGSTYRYINATPSAGNAPPNGTYWVDITGHGLVNINLPDAGSSTRGVVTITAQTFSGTKTFNDGIVVISGATGIGTNSSGLDISNTGFWASTGNGGSAYFFVDGTTSSNGLATLEMRYADSVRARSFLKRGDFNTIPASASFIVSTDLWDGSTPTDTKPCFGIDYYTGSTLTHAVGAWATVGGLTFMGGLYVSGALSVGVADGGTGATTFTAHGILLGEGTSAIVATAAMTNGQILVGQTGADPLPKTMSGDATLAASGALTLATVTVAKGGTGDTTLTNHGIMLGQGTSAVVVTAAMTDGQLLVGQTGADPLPKTISGDITVAASGAVTLATVTLAKGGTGSSLADPGANKILAWDDTDNTVGFWTLGTGLTYTHATHTLSASGGTTSPLTTKGDIWVYSTTDDRLPVGADESILIADSTAAEGVRWVVPGTISGGASIAVATISGGTLTQTKATGNVASITRTSQGVYKVTFTASYADANSYGVSAITNVSGSGGELYVSARNAGDVTLTLSTNVADVGWLSVTITS